MPSTLGTIVAASVTGALVPRFGPRIFLALGACSSAIGMLLLTQIGLDTRYGSGVLPGDFLVGVGLGMSLMPASNIILADVDTGDTGVVSALNNATIQISVSHAPLTRELPHSI